MILNGIWGLVKLQVVVQGSKCVCVCVCVCEVCVCACMCVCVCCTCVKEVSVCAHVCVVEDAVNGNNCTWLSFSVYLPCCSPYPLPSFSSWETSSVGCAINHQTATVIALLLYEVQRD